MERLKVLSAALALREFTVNELAALSGVKPNTVKSVLDREEFVQRLGSTGSGRRGRPSTKWAIVDSNTTRELTAELDALSSVEPPKPTLSRDDRRDVAVGVAEQALSHVIDEDDFVVQREIVISAQASLHMADEQQLSFSAQPWWQDDPDSFAVRARGVDALATLATTPHSEISYYLLKSTTTDVAAAMDAVPEQGDAIYYAPLSHILAAHDTFAPLLWLSCQTRPPSRVSKRWTALHMTGLDLNDTCVLTQSWATPLCRVSAAMPMLLTSAGPTAMPPTIVVDLLRRTRTIPHPLLVFGGARQKDVMRDAVRAGAFFVPVDWRSSANRQLAIEAVTAAIDRHAATDLIEVAAEGSTLLTEQVTAAKRQGRGERKRPRLDPRACMAGNGPLSRWLHAALVCHLVNDPAAVLAKARGNIALGRQTGAIDEHSEPYARQWESVLDAGIPAIIAALTGTSDRDDDLRSSTPFAGVLPPREVSAIKAAYRAWRDQEPTNW